MRRNKADIVAFLCTWCAYGGADRAGVEHRCIPEGIRVVRVPCSGAIEPQLVLTAFASGAAGVMILACHPGDCHYESGNRRALQRNLLLRRLLEQLGIESERMLFDYVSLTEGERFAELASCMTDRLALLDKETRYDESEDA